MIIYKATNLVNGKVYIGQTVKTLEKRKRKHINDAVSNRSKNVFHKALRKYGEDNFTWEVIDSAESETELSEKEIYWISFYHSYIYVDNSNGYNMTIGGEGANGFKHSDETKKKMGDLQKLNGTKRGENSPIAKLTEDDVLRIKELIKARVPFIEIANNFNISKDAIISIKRGHNWSHIGENVSQIKYSKVKCSKLNEDEVVEIKILLKDGKLTQKEIGNKFNVDNVTICNINTGKTWGQIGDDMSNFDSGKIGNSRLTKDDVIEIKLLLKEGNLTHKEISEMFGVARAYISHIKSGKAWKHVEIA